MLEIGFIRGGVNEWNLMLSDDAVMKPVGNVLAADSKRGAIFHQTDVVNVWDFGASDSLINPAHNIAKDALAMEMGQDNIIGSENYKRSSVMILKMHYDSNK